MLEIDRWALLQLDDLVTRVVSAYEAYEFHTVHHAVHNFCAVTMSSLYLDILKDRLYTSVASSRERRSAQTALHRIGHAVCRLMAPLVPFTAEEIWETLPRQKDDPESVHLALFPAPAADRAEAAALRRDWETLLSVREAVTGALEVERREGRIGGSVEAAVRLKAPADLAALLERCKAELPALFIVSKVDVETAPAPREAAGLEVSVGPAPGTKCLRCWNVLESVGADAGLAELCARCAAAVRAIRRSAS
jgi:isoleucyl-tRNA synthetase